MFALRPVTIATVGLPGDKITSPSKAIQSVLSTLGQKSVAPVHDSVSLRN